MYSGNQASYDNLSENMKQKLEGLKTPIVNDLTTGGSDKALSAESGKELKSLVDEKADSEDLKSLQTEVTEHLAEKVLSEDGAHGIRYFNNELAVKNDVGQWETIDTGYAKDCEGVDLNTLLDTGIYTAKGGELALHYPLNFSKSYQTIVIVNKAKDNWVYQTWIYATPEQNVMYTRALVLGNWNTWTKISFDSGDGGVLVLSPGNGWSTSNSGDYLRAVKVDKVVTVSGKVTLISNTNNSNTQIVSLPSGYRPLSDIIVHIAGDVNTITVPPKFFHGILSTNGILYVGGDIVGGKGTQVSNLISGGKYSFTISFIVD